MELAKVREIIELNIKEVGNKMPPDTLTALKISTAAVEAIQIWRDDHDDNELLHLPGETPD